MTVRMRHTRAHTRNRRSHHALKSPTISKCSNCGEAHIRHTVCRNCGQYRGKQVVDVVKEMEKKQSKAKAEEKKMEK